MQNLSNQQRRQVRGLISMALLLIGFLYFFYFNSDSQESITFGFVLGEEWKLINEWTIASKSGAILFLSIALIGIAIGYLRFRQEKSLNIGSFLFGFGAIMAFLCWAAAGKFIPFTGLLQGAIMLSVPLIFGSMSGLLCEKSCQLLKSWVKKP
jgi:simple sugar transport system permease protein